MMKRLLMMVMLLVLPACLLAQTPGTSRQLKTDTLKVYKRIHFYPGTLAAPVLGDLYVGPDGTLYYCGPSGAFEVGSGGEGGGNGWKKVGELIDLVTATDTVQIGSGTALRGFNVLKTSYFSQYARFDAGLLSVDTVRLGVPGSSFGMTKYYSPLTNYSVLLYAPGVTADRTAMLPNATGTLAMTNAGQEFNAIGSVTGTGTLTFAGTSSPVASFQYTTAGTADVAQFKNSAGTAKAGVTSGGLVWADSGYFSAGTRTVRAHQTLSHFYMIDAGELVAGEIGYSDDGKFYYYDTDGLHEFGSGGGSSGTITGGLSLGGTAVYAGVSGANLTFKGLSAGTDVSVTSGSNTLTIGLGSNVPRLDATNSFTAAQTITKGGGTANLTLTNTGSGRGLTSGTASGTAVYGASTSGTGMHGLSNTGTAGYFYSTLGIGVQIDVNGDQSPLVVRAGGVEMLNVGYDGYVGGQHLDFWDVAADSFLTGGAEPHRFTDSDLGGHDSTGLAAMYSKPAIWTKTPGTYSSYTPSLVVRDSSAPFYLGYLNASGTGLRSSPVHVEGDTVLVVDSTAKFLGAAYSLADSITGTDISWKRGNYFYKTIGGNTSFTFSDTLQPGQSILVRITASGAYTAGFPASVKWVGGTTPTQTASGTDFYSFAYDPTFGIRGWKEGTSGAEREVFNTGLMDSTKLTDTMAVKRIYPARTLSRITYDALRGGVFTVRLEAVDSLGQSSGAQLVDTTTVTTQTRERTSAAAGCSWSITAGKLLRVVFTQVAVMPKVWMISGSGIE